MNPEEELKNFIEQSEKLVKDLKRLSERLENQLEKAKENEGDNYAMYCAMCEFRSMTFWNNPISGYLKKTIRTIPDIDNAFREKKEKGFECFGL